MAIGFPGSPFNKKQFSVDSKLYEYNSTLGAWSKSVRAPVSPGTATITDISNLVDGSSLLDNPGSTIPSYATEVEVLSQSVGVQDGQMAYAEDTDKLYVFSGYSWYKTSTSVQAVTPPAPFTWGGDRGISAGDLFNSSAVTAMHYFSISVLSGNATDFGNMTVARATGAGASNGTQALLMGGRAGGYYNTVDKVTFATLSNAVDATDLSASRGYNSGVGDGTYAFSGGGYESAPVSTVESFNISTPSTATAHGNLTEARYGAAAMSNGNIGVWAGGTSGTGASDVIDQVTLATAANATSFGNLLAVDGTNKIMASTAVCGTSDNTYGVIMGGGSGSDSSDPSTRANTTIEYITISTAGNSQDFGDLTLARYGMSAVSDGTYGVGMSGHIGINSNGTNRLDYITIASPGNATTFGENRYIKRDQMDGISGD